MLRNLNKTVKVILSAIFLLSASIFLYSKMQKDILPEEKKISDVSVKQNKELKRTQAIFFSTENCGKCMRTEEDLNLLKKKYPEFDFLKIDSKDEEIFLFYEFLAEKLDIDEKRIFSSPAVVINGKFIDGKDLSGSCIEEAVKECRFIDTDSMIGEYLKQKGAIAEDLKGKIKKRFEGFSALPVFIAGAIDGINPCAFGVIIFFVTCLWAVRKRKKEILLVGVFFICAVFLTYFFIGLGVIRLIVFLPVIRTMVSIIYLGIAIVLFILAFLSGIDAFKYYKHKESKMTLGLSEVKKSRIFGIISSNVRSSHFVFGAVISAFLVSITELACTGQVYLPTILYILEIENLKYRAMYFLFLYNLSFIVPLVIIFIISFSGINSYGFARIARKNILIGKILLTLCFIGLGVIFLFIR